MDEMVKLILFIAGEDADGGRLVKELHHFFDTAFKGRHELTVVDLLKNPEPAFQHKILSIPTLIRESPPPSLRFIGKLDNTEELRKLLALDH